MKPANVIPRDTPRVFHLDEMFFSTTDRRGVIALGNVVFVRVSGYPEADLIGSPHNIIRHPDMPRAAFRLVWSHLLAGQPVVAYVKNLAADGAYYSVVALITPVGNGFLSIRFKPTSRLHAVVDGIYARMRAAEIALRDQPDGGRKGMDAAAAILADSLKEQGFRDYDAFMRAMLHEELASRTAALAAERLPVVPPWPEAATGDQIGPLAKCLHAVYCGGRQAYQHIQQLGTRLDAFAAMNEELENKSGFVLGLTREFRFISINAALESTRLGEQGGSLGVIANYLGQVSMEISRTVEGLTTRIHAVLEKLRAIIFHFSAARLQIEMTLIFCRESLDRLLEGGERADASAVATQRTMIEQLQAAFGETNARATGELGSLAQDLTLLDQHAQELHRTVTALQVAHVSGLIEANQLKDEEAFAGMFGDVRTQIDNTRDELAGLDTIIERLGALSREAPAIAAAVNGIVAQMARDVAGLTDGETSAGASGRSPARSRESARAPAPPIHPQPAPTRLDAAHSG
jgi:aerotaxis receptor